MTPPGDEAAPATTPGEPLKVAVLFFGMARNLAATIGSIRAMLREPNAGPGLRMTVFASLNLVDRVWNPRTGEAGAPVNHRQIFQLEADHYELIRQEEAAIAPALEAAQQRRDRYNDGWASVRNLLHQLTSLRRGWAMMQRSQAQPFDGYVFLRPDLEYLDPIDIAGVAARFAGPGCLAVPAWHSWGGLNDRMAIADPVAAEAYANRIALVPEYCGRHALQSEALLAFAAERAGLKVGALPVRARRVRANGRAARDDFAAEIRPLPEVPAPLGAGVATAAELRKPLPPRPAPPAPAPPGSRRITVEGFPRAAPLGGIGYQGLLDGLHRHGGVRRYLEIGTQSGLSLALARCPAISIDPSYRLDKEAWGKRPGMHLFEMTSDDFFAAHDPVAILGGPVDLGFIDGMHLAEFVLRDFVNLERAAAPGGTIAIHDVYPGNFEMAERRRRTGHRKDKALARAWTGDVWRVLPLLARERPDLRIEVMDCPPTGIALVTGLDPASRHLAERLPALCEELAAAAPEEAAFWTFIETVPLSDSRAALARLTRAAA